LPDYVAGIVSWDPSLVTSCLERVQEVTGRTWATAISRELHFSEFILYGTYVRHFAGVEQRSFIQPSTLCHSYWSPTPMSQAQVSGFIEAFGATDVAVHIQSNSSTPGEIREQVLTRLGIEAKR
jgi:hypothetical protein